MLSNSHEYLNMTGNIVIAWRWLEMERVAVEALHAPNNNPSTSLNGNDFYSSIQLTSRYYYEYELGKIYHSNEIIHSLCDINLVMEDKYF